MKKQFGQHFLRQVPRELLFPLDELEKKQSLQKTARIYIREIGPGSGVVTKAVLEQLLPFSHLLITYEVVDIDGDAIVATRDMIEALKLPKRFKTVYTHKDVLLLKTTPYSSHDFVYIFGSLPYNVSKKIVNAAKQISLQLHDNATLLPSRFVIQKEVADDYVSQAPQARFLGMDLSLYSDYRKITKNLPPGAFYPPPKVDSAVLEIGWRKVSDKDKPSLLAIAKVIRTGFIAKRKVILSVFKKAIPQEKITPTHLQLLHMRAHELSLAEWRALSEIFG